MFKISLIQKIDNGIDVDHYSISIIDYSIQLNENEFILADFIIIYSKDNIIIPDHAEIVYYMNKDQNYVLDDLDKILRKSIFSNKQVISEAISKLYDI
jgi:hypothetical protein